MNLGHWLKSLSASDKLILLILYAICIFLSKITLESLIEYYDMRKKNSQFRIRFRITPASLLGLGLIYCIIMHQILGAMFDFIP